MVKEENFKNKIICGDCEIVLRENCPNKIFDLIFTSPPYADTANKYKESKNPNIIWEGHKASRDIGYCHLEKLHNLEALPSDGFYISCFPVKIRGASAGWTRAVAIFDDKL